MEEILKSKYHRDEPVIKFDVNQSLYDTVMNANSHNMVYWYSNYFGNNKSFLELKDETDRLITAFHRDGIKEGDTVGICLLTQPEVAPCLLGIHELGATEYYMDASVKPQEYLKAINEKNMKELVLFEPLKPILDGIIDYTNLQRVILVSPTEFSHPKREKLTDERFVYYNDFVNLEADNNIKHVKYDKDRENIIVKSSGSTGVSKSIVHTVYNFNSQVEKMSYLDLPFYKGNRSFVCAPPWVIYGLVCSIYSGLVFGNQVGFSLEPKESMIYDALGTYDFVYGVPVYYRYLYEQMVKFKEEDNIMYNIIRRKLKDVDTFISGGDKLPEEEILRWQRMFDVPIVNGYGNNEVVGAAIVSPKYANKPGSIGVSSYGNDVKAFDEDGNMLGINQEGEICIATDSMFKKYFGNEEETNRVKKYHNNKQWVHTGDKGYIDKDGYVYITGRIGRLIIDKLGYKISPETSEKLIESNPFVKECIVVGVEVAPKDTVPMAFIEFNDEYKNNELLIEDIKNLCENSLKEYEYPKYYVEIDKMPHKSNGGKRDFKKCEELAKEYINNNELKLELK